jgi:hypothetical protein
LAIIGVHGDTQKYKSAKIRPQLKNVILFIPAPSSPTHAGLDNVKKLDDEYLRVGPWTMDQLKHILQTHSVEE